MQKSLYTWHSIHCSPWHLVQRADSSLVYEDIIGGTFLNLGFGTSAHAVEVLSTAAPPPPFICPLLYDDSVTLHHFIDLIKP